MPIDKVQSSAGTDGQYHVNWMKQPVITLHLIFVDGTLAKVTQDQQKCCCCYPYNCLARSVQLCFHIRLQLEEGISGFGPVSWHLST